MLERAGRGASPTAAGRVLFERATHLLSAADALRGDMVDLARGMAGELRLGAFSPAVSGALPVRRPGAESPRVVARFADLLAERRDGRGGPTET
jgi:DNA-binding transcriptional LysR family regulator